MHRRSLACVLAGHVKQVEMSEGTIGVMLWCKDGTAKTTGRDGDTPSPSDRMAT